MLKMIKVPFTDARVYVLNKNEVKDLQADVRAVRVLLNSNVPKDVVDQYLSNIEKKLED